MKSRNATTESPERHPVVVTQSDASGRASAGMHNELNINIGTIISYPAQLPVASELEAIERLAPGATRDLIAMQQTVVGMAQLEQTHRHQMDREESVRRTRGGLIGPALGAVAIVGAVWAGLMGHTEVATALGGGTAVAVVAVIVTGKIPSWRRPIKRDSAD